VAASGRYSNPSTQSWGAPLRRAILAPSRLRTGGNDGELFSLAPAGYTPPSPPLPRRRRLLRRNLQSDLRLRSNGGRDLPALAILRQVTRESVRAVESCKATLPLLLEISHDDYARRRPGWKQAMAANATRIPPDRIPTIIPALVAGLSVKGIQAETNGHAPRVIMTKDDTQTPATAQTPIPHTATTPASAAATPPSRVPSTAKVETFAPAAATTTTQISPTAATTQTQ
jgi:hypothetical protein